MCSGCFSTEVMTEMGDKGTMMIYMLRSNTDNLLSCEALKQRMILRGRRLWRLRNRLTLSLARWWKQFLSLRLRFRRSTRFRGIRIKTETILNSISDRIANIARPFTTTVVTQDVTATHTMGYRTLRLFTTSNMLPQYFHLGAVGRLLTLTWRSGTFGRMT